MRAQLRLTLRNPLNCSPPGSSVHGISQARILERVAMSSFRGSSQPRDQSHISGSSCPLSRWGNQPLIYQLVFFMNSLESPFPYLVPYPHLPSPLILASSVIL